MPTLLQERVIVQSEGMGFLTDTPEGALTSYAPLKGDQWGRVVSHGRAPEILLRLLELAPDMLAHLEPSCGIAWKA